MTSGEIVQRVKQLREDRQRADGTWKPPHQPKDSFKANWSVFLAIAVPATLMALAMLVLAMRERPEALPVMLVITGIAAGGISFMLRHITSVEATGRPIYENWRVRLATATRLITAMILAGGGVLMALTAIIQSATK